MHSQQGGTTPQFEVIRAIFVEDSPCTASRSEPHHNSR